MAEHKLIDIDLLERYDGKIKDVIEDVDSQLNGENETYDFAPIITIEDNKVPSNLADCKVKIDPVQDLHGYDKPWVGGAGKNKLPMTVDGIKAANSEYGSWSGNVYTRNGITFTILTDSDGNVVGIMADTGSSYSTAQTDFVLTPSITLTEGDKLNGATNGSVNKWGLGISDRGVKQSVGGDYTITSDDTSANRTIYIRIFNAISVSNQMFYPMLRASTETDSTFAPYTNICSIAGRDSLNIKIYEENLLNSNVITGYINATTGKLTASTSSKTVYAYLNPGKYTFDKISSAANRIGIYDSIEIDSPARAYDNMADLPYTFTLNSVGYAAFFVVNASSSSDLENETAILNSCMLTKVGKYKNYYIPLPQTVYSGSFDTSNGLLAITHGFIDSYNGETLPGEWISSMDEYTSGGAPTTGSEVCYELSTPTIIQLTPTQIQLLLGTNNIYASTGDISVTTNNTVINAIGQLTEEVNDHEERIEVVESELDTVQSDLTNVDIALDVPEGTGKNRMPLILSKIKSDNTDGTWADNVYTLNGVSFTFNVDSNGVVTSVVANGQATATAAVSLKGTSYKPNVLYTLTGCPEGGGGSTYRLNAANLGNIGYDDGNGATYSYTDNTTHTVSLRVYNSYNAQNVVFRPMVRLASVSDPTFAPYIPSVERRIEAVESGKIDKLTRISNNVTVTDTSATQSISSIEGCNMLLFVAKINSSVRNTLLIPYALFKSGVDVYIPITKQTTVGSLYVKYNSDTSITLFSTIADYNYLDIYGDK